MDNNDFIEFLKSFDNDFLMPVSEISRSHSQRRDILIKNSMKMYSFDDICQNSPMLKNNLPKSTDALWYKVENGKMTIYIIEFKFFNIDSDNSSYKSLELIQALLETSNVSYEILEKFEKVKNNFVDSVEVSLRLKPFETLMIALPLLYEEYSGNRDFDEFLKDCDVKLYVFVNRTAPNRNVAAERSYTHSINNALKHQYNRLKQARIISYYSILASHQFNDFLAREKLR